MQDFKITDYKAARLWIFQKKVYQLHYERQKKLLRKMVVVMARVLVVSIFPDSLPTNVELCVIFRRRSVEFTKCACPIISSSPKQRFDESQKRSAELALIQFQLKIHLWPASPGPCKNENSIDFARQFCVQCWWTWTIRV